MQNASTSSSKLPFQTNVDELAETNSIHNAPFTGDVLSSEQPTASAQNFASASIREMAVNTNFDLTSDLAQADLHVGSSSNHAVSSQQSSGTLRHPEPRKRRAYTRKKMPSKWTEKEHNSLLVAIGKYGRHWPLIQKYVRTKDISQVRSHAQKHFDKLERAGMGQSIPPPRKYRRRSNNGESQRKEGRISTGFPGDASTAIKQAKLFPRLDKTFCLDHCQSVTINGANPLYNMTQTSAMITLQNDSHLMDSSREEMVNGEHKHERMDLKFDKELFSCLRSTNMHPQVTVPPTQSTTSELAGSSQGTSHQRTAPLCATNDASAATKIGCGDNILGELREVQGCYPLYCRATFPEIDANHGSRKSETKALCLEARGHPLPRGISDVLLFRKRLRSDRDTSVPVTEAESIAVMKGNQIPDCDLNGSFQPQSKASNEKSSQFLAISALIDGNGFTTEFTSSIHVKNFLNDVSSPGVDIPGSVGRPRRSCISSAVVEQPMNEKRETVGIVSPHISSASPDLAATYKFLAKIFDPEE